MADVQANIGINIDATAALAQLKNLQRQISVFNAEIARGGGKAAAAAASMQQELVSSINATGQFSASMTRIRSTTESFTNALEKNKLTMGQTFRYAGGATKKFGHLFTNEFNTIEKVARERVKTIQTQYIKMGRDANGAIKAISVRPLALDMDNLATRTAMAAQKQQILNQLLRQGSTNLLNWGKNTQWAGRQLMVGFTIPLSIFGGLAAKTFMDLEEQAIKFKRVYGDLFTTPEQTNQAFEDMKNLGLEFTRFGVAVEKTIGLAASVAQMGMTGAALTAQVTEATRLAVLGGMEQEEALNTTISLTNAFGIASEDLTEKINFLNAAENQTILSIQDFNEAVPRAGSVVAQLGGGVEDLAFFLTAMREGGIEASQGANALKTSLGRLVNPTARAREELMAYGIDVVGIVEGNAGNLRQTVLDLGAALEQLDPLDKARAIERLFGKFQFARMSALFNNIMDDGSQAATVLDLINTNAAELGDLASKELGRVEESASTKFRSAVEQFQAALAPIGESFLKLVTPIIEFGTKVINAFNNLNDGAKGFVVALVAIIGAVGPVLLMTIGLLANGIANIMKMFLGLQTVFQKMRGESTELGNQTQYMTQEQLEAASVASSLNQSHATLAQTFTSEATAVQRLTAEYQKLVVAQRNSLGIPMRSVGASAPGFAKGRKVPGYKDGVVMVPGPKGAGDIQPAMLAPGEAVIPAAMADKYGPLINAMIEGAIPGYDGGRASVASRTSTAVASHVSGADPRQLAETVKRLQEAGYSFEAVVDRMTVNADGLGYTIERAEGNLAELVSTTDILVAGGQTFAGTTVPESSARNAMYNDAGISGSALTMDELFQQEQQLIAAMERDETLYQKHSVEIEKLIAESREAQAILASSNDQAQTKLAYDKERARQAIAFSKVTQEGMSQEMAEQQAGELVEQADLVYAEAIKRGHSKEEALNQARDKLLATMIQSGSGHYVVGDSSIGTDPVRARAAGKGFATSDPRRRAFNQARSEGSQAEFFEYGEGFGEGQRKSPASGKVSAPQAQKAGMVNLEAEGQRLIVAARESVSKLAKEAVIAMENQLKNDLQSSSPSRVMRDEMGNAVDGAVQALREGQDDMRQGGQELAQAADQGFNNFPAEGATPGTRGGKGRVQTAGPTTPGQPVRYSILNDEIIENSKTVSSFGTKVSDAAGKVSGMANKLGTVGIGLSSLVGGLSMVEGPLGELAGKLFPLMSVVTGLTFAMQMLSTETIKAIGDKINDAIADGASAKNAMAKATADAHSARMSQINAAATQRETVASNLAAQADTRQAAASTAATRGLAAMTATSMFAGGGQIGTVAGNVVGKGVAGASLAGSGMSAAFIAVQARMVSVFGKITTIVSKAGAGIARAFGMLGSVVSGLFRGILALLGPVGLIIAGFALLAGGITLLVKVINDQRAKVSGLGDAANLSAEKLRVLNDILGTSISGIEYSPIGSAGGAVVEGADQQATARSTQESLQESDEFKKEYKGVIAAVGGASQAAATQALTSMAVALQAGGAEEEVVAGIVNAILAEAGRTDVEIQFGNLTVADATESAAQAAQTFAEGYNFVDNASSGFGAGSYEAGALDTFSQADLELAAGAMTSAIGSATAQLDSGAIGLDEYNTEMQKVQDTMSDLSATGPDGLAAAARLAKEMGNNLEEAGLEGISDEISSFVDSGTATGVDSATAIMQARAAGTDISESEMQSLQAGSAEGADERVIRNAQRTIDAIEKRTASTREATEAQQQLDEAVEASEEFSGRIGQENEALQQQIDTYDEVSSAIAGNSEIVDKAAFAQKIANDETLRAEWANAQAAGTTDQFIAAMQEQSVLQDQINAQQAEADLDSRISSMQEQVSTYEAATAATEGLALGEEGQAIAYQIAADAALSEAFAIAQSTDAKNGNSDATDALILKLKEEADLRNEIAGQDPTRTPRGGSGGGSTPTSFLDKTVQSLRDVSSAQTKVTKGFSSSLRAIVAFGKAGVRSVRGLSSQLRGAGVSEGFAEQLLGMDPEEWEKQKKQLFNFDAAGNITGLTAAGQAIQDALNVVEIGNFIDEQESLTVSVGHQITALTKLTDAGASYEVAYKAVQNTAFAAAISTAKSSAEIQAAAEAAMAAQAKMEELEKINEEEERKKRISEAVREMNKEFSNQAKILDYINANRSKLSEAQIGAVLSNKDLQNLLLEPNIDPQALEQALKNAEAQADMDVAISIAKGEADVPMEDELAAIQNYFDKAEAVINLQYNAVMADDNELIEDAQKQIASIEYQLDDYNAELERISWQEDAINEKYDKRSEALDQIADTNQKIAEQQQAQLNIADALSRGDIAAAARAAADLRAQQAADAQASQQDMLEKARQTELGAVTGPSGMTREQLEEQIKNLERQMFEIEEGMLEPAEERVRLAELERALAVEQLELNGQTRDEFEGIADNARLAYLNMEDLIDATKRFAALASFMTTGEKDAAYFEAFPNDPDNPANKRKPAPSSSGGGGGGGSAPAGKANWVDSVTGKTLQELAGNRHWTEYYNENRGLDTRLVPASSGGLIKMAMGGKVNKYAGGGMIIPKRMAAGGLSMGSDVVPALLTPGEFVVRRPAVNKIGVDTLKDINNGTYNDGSVYNYNLAVNVKSNSDPNKIARTVITQIKGIENQRIRGNRL